MKTESEQLLHLVIALARAGDLDMLPQVVSGERLVVAEELASLVKEFSYVNSSKFEALKRGKSQAMVVALTRRYSEPMKRTEMRDEFFRQLSRLPESAEVEGLLPSHVGPRLKAVRSKLEALHAT